MAPVPEVFGQMAIALVTVAWGIYVETRFSSKSTILFNVVALIVILITLDLEFWLYFAVGIYAAVAILVTWRVENKFWKHKLRHLFGNKGYGALALALGLWKLNISKVLTSLLCG